MVIYTRDLSRALSKLQVIAKNSDSFIVMFAPVMYGGVITLVFVFQASFSNSLIIHQSTNQSKYTNLATCVCLETPMKHRTEAFPLYFDKASNPRA